MSDKLSKKQDYRTCQLNSLRDLEPACKESQIMFTVFKENT